MKLMCGIAIAVCLSSCSYTPVRPPYSATADPASGYAQGHIDGERDYRASPAWIVAGVGCGLFGVGYAWLVPPEPPSQALVDKEAEYALGYREGYRGKGRSGNTLYACLGWVTWLLILVAASGE